MSRKIIKKSPQVRVEARISRSPSWVFQKKHRIGSQQTIDTATNEKESQYDNILRINQDEVAREIKLCLESIESYKGSLLKHKQTSNLREELRQKQAQLQQKSRQILELNEEITRLKDVFNRPKQKQPANPYFQQHLKTFTLAQQLQKQHKHLQLHITHHSNLKLKAKQISAAIRNIFRSYQEVQKKRGLKVVSYAEFRRRAIASRQEKLLKQQRRSLSQRSLSYKSRSSSVRSIISGEASILHPPQEKNLYQLQRKKSIVGKARSTSFRRHLYEKKTLEDQLEFLRTEDAQLQQKQAILKLEYQKLNETTPKNYQFTFVSGDFSQFSRAS